MTVPTNRCPLLCGDAQCWLPWGHDIAFQECKFTAEWPPPNPMGPAIFERNAQPAGYFELVHPFYGSFVKPTFAAAARALDLLKPWRPGESLR